VPGREFAVILIGTLAIIVASLFIFGIISFPQVPKGESSRAEENMAEVQELKIEDIEEGTGDSVESGDEVVIHYNGTLKDGTKFDSSYDRGEPFQTQIGTGQVIEGWDKGVVGMKVGGKRKLIIPPSMGYGDAEIPGIPAGSTLIFEVELLEVLK
jgi:peptidylprolyl isomerase